MLSHFIWRMTIHFRISKESLWDRNDKRKSICTFYFPSLTWNINVMSSHVSQIDLFARFYFICIETFISDNFFHLSCFLKDFAKTSLKPKTVLCSFFPSNKNEKLYFEHHLRRLQFQLDKKLKETLNACFVLVGFYL